MVDGDEGEGRREEEAPKRENDGGVHESVGIAKRSPVHTFGPEMPLLLLWCVEAWSVNLRVSLLGPWRACQWQGTGTRDGDSRNRGDHIECG